MDAARYDRRILVERGVDAREIEVSVLGNDSPSASIPGEIRPQSDFYSYEAKYILDNSELIIPAQLSIEQRTGARNRNPCIHGSRLLWYGPGGLLDGEIQRKVLLE